MERKSREQTGLLILILAAALLRFWHIGWGLPEIYEEATPYSIAWKMWHWGGAGLDPNPHFFNYPALLFYLNFFVQGCYYWAGHLIGWFPSPEAFHHASTLNPSALLLAARTISVLFDLGTVLMLYLLTRAYAGPAAAFAASLLAALNPLLVRSAHLVNVDTPLTFFVMASLLCIDRLYRTGELKWYLLAGAGIGLAASSKYNGAFLLPVLLAAQAVRSRSLRPLFGLPVVSAAAIAGAIFVMCNPYILLSPAEFQRDFSYEEGHMAAGHLGLDPTQGTAAFYLGQVLPGTFGIPLMIVIAAGLIVLLIRFRKEELVLLLFPLLYAAVLVSWNMRAERYLLPVIPPLLFAGALGMTSLWNSLGSGGRMAALRRGWVRYPLCLAAGVLLLRQGVGADLEYHRSLSLGDTRAVAKEWIFEHVPHGAVIATLPLGLALPDTLYRVFHMPFLAVNMEQLAPFFDTRWYEDFDIVVGSDFDYGRYRTDSLRYRPFLDYYDSLRSRFDLAFEVVPSGSQTGPAIWCYRPRQEHRTATYPEGLFEGLKKVHDRLWVKVFLNNLGLMLFGKGKLEKAGQVYAELVSADSGDVNARRSLAAILLKLGRPDEALAQVQQSLARAPDDAMLLALEGRIYLALGKDTLAEGGLRRAIALNPAIGMPYDDLLILYRRRGNTTEELEILTRHLAVLDPAGAQAAAIRSEIDSVKRARP